MNTFVAIIDRGDRYSHLLANGATNCYNSWHIF
nr:MAG TPA: hypothetical protein [Caudoviricetes sp.]